MPVLKAAATDAAALRRYKKGEIICEEGAFGSTAFYIVSGKVDIFIASPMAHIRTKASTGSIFNRSLSKISSILSTDSDRGTGRRLIPVDAPVDLDVRNPVAQLEKGDLFGEMTCRTFQPRSATVRAAEDCEIVELLRVVLDMLFGTREVSDHVKETTKVKAQTFKGTSFKKDFDEKYRRRGLQNHLSSVHLFESIGKEFLDYLVETVKLETVLKGEVICSEGDAGDGFYLIRNGMVKVSKKRPGGEVVLNYLSRGEFFGEVSLITEQTRTATCTALDTVDLVKIDRADFKKMLDQFPQFQAEVSAIAQKRMETGNQMQKTIQEEVGLEEFLDQGLLEAQNLLIIDLDKCTRCDLCVQACAESHDGASRLIRDGLRYDKYLVPTACRSCKDPLCMTQCPVGAIRRTNTLEIKIEDWCTGCTRCEQLCPFGNITMHTIGNDSGKRSWLGQVSDFITTFSVRKKVPVVETSPVAKTAAAPPAPAPKAAAPVATPTPSPAPTTISAPAATPTPTIVAAATPIVAPAPATTPTTAVVPATTPTPAIVPNLPASTPAPTPVVAASPSPSPVAKPATPAPVAAAAPVPAAKAAAPAAAAAAAKPAPQKLVMKATTCDLCMDYNMPSCVYACPHDAAKRVNPATFFAKQMPSLKTKQKFKLSASDRTTHTENK